MSQAMNSEAFSATAGLMGSVEAMGMAAAQQIAAFNTTVQRLQALVPRVTQAEHLEWVQEVSVAVQQVHMHLFATVADTPATPGIEDAVEEVASDASSIEASLRGLAELIQLSQMRSKEVDSLLTTSAARLDAIEAALNGTAEVEACVAEPSNAA